MRYLACLLRETRHKSGGKRCVSFPYLITSQSGASYELYQAARRFEVVFVLCEQHFAEMAQVLTYDRVLRLGGGVLTPAYTFRIAGELHRISDPVPKLEWPSCPDPKDWYLLDLLLASNADGIISKDSHLLSAAQKVGLPVMTPAELWARGIT